jgi:hypothetical protein
VVLLRLVSVSSRDVDLLPEQLLQWERSTYLYLIGKTVKSRITFKVFCFRTIGEII